MVTVIVSFIAFSADCDFQYLHAYFRNGFYFNSSPVLQFMWLHITGFSSCNFGEPTSELFSSFVARRYFFSFILDQIQLSKFSIFCSILKYTCRGGCISYLKHAFNKYAILIHTNGIPFFIPFGILIPSTRARWKPHEIVSIELLETINKHSQ